LAAARQADRDRSRLLINATDQGNGSTQWIKAMDQRNGSRQWINPIDQRG
jgi:hypothetical protein